MGVGAALTETVEEPLALVEGSGPGDAGTEGIASLHCWAITDEPCRRIKNLDDRIQPVTIGLKGVK